MLPPSLASAYRHYKADTDAVASWLASTAKARGCPATLLRPDTTLPRPAGRLKGKARKEANKAAEESSRDGSPKHIIPIKSFVPLAEHILSCKPAVPIPAAFVTTLNRVIKTRAEFAQQLSKQQVETTAFSDQTHSFFVSVLIKVLEVLQPLMPTVVAAPRTSASAVPADDADSVGNRFASLEMHEPSQEFLDAPDVERPTNVASDKTVYEAESQKSPDEALFAYGMLVRDLKDIRNKVKWIWANYREGCFELTAAAITTNTAIDMARHLIADIEPMLHTNGGAWAMAERLNSACFERAEDANEASAPANEASAPAAEDHSKPKLDSYSLAEDIFLSFAELRPFLVGHPQSYLPIPNGSVLVPYDPASNRSAKTFGDKCQEDRTLLLDAFAGLMAVVRAIPDYPVQDEFLRGIRELDQTGEAPFYLAFAAQVFLDINHVLREKARVSYEYLEHQLSSMDGILQSYLDLHDSPRGRTWQPFIEVQVREFRRKISWFQGDPVFKVSRDCALEYGHPVPATLKPHTTLIRSPVLAGLALFHFRAQLHELGIEVAGLSGSILVANHLYNALQKEKLLEGLWDDMDAINATVDGSNFFVGEPPSNVKDYHRRLCLQGGVSAAFLSGASRTRVRTAAKSISRSRDPRIKPNLPVSSMFVKRYWRGAEQVNWTPELVYEILAHTQAKVVARSTDGRSVVLHRIIKPDRRGEAKKARQDRVRGGKRTRDGAFYAPERLLVPLLLALQVEVVEMAFPYLLFHQVCWKLFRSIGAHCEPLLREYDHLAPADPAQEFNIIRVGTLLLLIASGDVGDEGDTPLRLAAEAMNAMILSGDGRTVLLAFDEVARAIGVSSGRELAPGVEADEVDCPQTMLLQTMEPRAGGR